MLVSTQASTTGEFSYAEYSDGKTPGIIGGAYSQVPNVNCNSAPTCAVGLAYFNGAFYAAYADAAGTGLVILEGIVSQTGIIYFNLAHEDFSVSPTTAPALVVFNGRLYIVFGASNNSSVKNAFYAISTADSVNYTPASDAGLGANSIASGSQPGMTVFNNKIYLVLQQNNSNRQLFVFDSADGETWTEVVQVSGLTLGAGASLITYNDSLVLASEQDNSNRALFVFSSADGINWGAQEYSGIRMGATPCIANYNGGVSLLIRSNDSRDVLYSSFGY